MSRMLGRMSPSWCVTCCHPPGLDCAESGRDSRAQKRLENRRWRSEAVASLMDEEDELVGLMRPASVECASRDCDNPAEDQSPYCAGCNGDLAL